MISIYCILCLKWLLHRSRSTLLLSHPKFGTNTKTADTTHALKGFEIIYHSNTKAFQGELGGSQRGLQMAS